MVTQTICGRIVKLRAGAEYVATLPLAAIRNRPVTVSIYRRDRLPYGTPTIELGNFYWIDAKAFLATFNNRSVSVAGRKWSAPRKRVRMPS